MPLILIVIVGVVVVAGLAFFLLPNRQPPEPPATSATATVTDADLFPIEVERPVALPVERRENEVSLDAAAPTQMGAYRDGTYTANAEYYTPKRQKHVISVTLSLRDDVVADVAVQYDGAKAKTPSHTRFDGAYEALVLGVEMDDLDLSRVGGASLTTTAFNEALGDITSDASL